MQLLAEWTETFPYDFRDERVMSHVRSITQKVAAVDDAAMEDVSVLLKNLLLRLTALERYEEGLARLATEAATEQLSQVGFPASNFRAPKSFQPFDWRYCMSPHRYVKCTFIDALQLA